MAGRHSSRRRAGVGAPLPIMAGLLVMIVTAWFTFEFLADRLGRQGCADPATIEVAAEPAIAPVLAEVAASTAPGLRSPETCYQIQVVSQEAAAVTDQLTGLAAGALPDVWVPDSTFWLRRARSGGAMDLPDGGASLATSPVVFAVAEPAARRLGWPDRKLTWQDVLGAGPTANALNVAMPDPARSPVGLYTLFGVRALVGNAPEPAAAQVAALRRLSPNVVARAAELFEKLPPADDPGTAGTAIVAFPTTEQDVLRHNGTDRERRLVPVYAALPVPALDYPYVVLPTTAGIERTGAERFLESLLEPAATRKLQAHGLRTPQGEVGAVDADAPDTGPPAARTGRPDLVPPDLVPVVPLPEQGATDDVLRVWTGVNLSARILAVIDVSGSMGAIVPGTGRSRAQLTAEAAKQGLGLFKPTTDVGLWVFSDNLDGDRDHRQLAPIAPLSTERDRLIELADRVDTMVGGKTNLYDTLLAGYQTVLQGWDAARLNVLVVLTDGRDDDVSSISRQELVDELNRLQDPKRPARIIFVGIGPDVDAAELDHIAAATGGRAFTTPDPAGIRDVFAKALAEMTDVS